MTRDDDPARRLDRLLARQRRRYAAIGALCAAVAAGAGYAYFSRPVIPATERVTVASRALAPGGTEETYHLDVEYPDGHHASLSVPVASAASAVGGRICVTRLRNASFGQETVKLVPDSFCHGG